jgi:hypothetical protein
MESSDRPARTGRWTSLWVVALLSFAAQLALCQFFTFGDKLPFSEDINPSNLWKLAYHFPPAGSFQVLNWLGVAYLPQPLNPLSLAAAHLSPWLFYTAYVPFISTMALLAMAAFLRELEISRPASLFSAVIFAWQGDMLSFIYPGHYGYLTSWPFFALAAWAALRAARTGRWPYAVISGAGCGIMVGLLTNADRGGIASLLIGALYLAPILRGENAKRPLFHLFLCVATAAVIALAPLLALYKSNIENVKIAGESNRETTYELVTQFSLGPAETLSYLVPGFFGWHINNHDGLYWGWIGEWPQWPRNHQTGPANLNLAISTSGTVATLLALMGAALVLPGRLFGPDRLSDRQRFYARVLLALGLVTLVLSWGWHTALYRPLFDYLPLMDKWRNPLKWLEMFNFALMPLSALAADHLIGALDANAAGASVARKRFLGYIAITLMLLAAGFVAAYALAEVFRAHFRSQGLDGLTVANMFGTMVTSLVWAIGMTLLLGLVSFALWHADALRRRTLVNPLMQRAWDNMLRAEHLPLTFALALALLSVVQLGWVADQFIQPVPTHAITDSNPLLETLRDEGDRVRVSVAVDDTTLNILLQNQFAALGIACLDISAASRIPNDLGAFLHALDNDHARLWFLAGVKNVVVPEAGLADLRSKPEVAANIAKIDGYTIEQTASPDLPSHALVEMKDYLAKATFVPAAEVLKEDDILKRLADPKWDPRGSILVEKPLPADPSLPPTQLADGVEVKTYTPTDIEIEAHSARGGYVLINDQFDADWEARINGEPAEMQRADAIMRAVRIGPGSSIVTMHYVAHYRIAGISLPAATMSNLSDGAMIAAWIVAGVALRRKKIIAP